MDDSEDLKKIDEIINKHKVEAEDPDDYAEFIDYSDINETDDIIEIDDYEIPEFTKSDITKFHTYTPSYFLTDEEKRIVESCPEPDLKQLLILNRNKNNQLMQLYKKIKDLLAECKQNITSKEEYINTSKNSRRVCHRIWRLGIPYFKTKDDFPCPRNEDIVRKHKNGELLIYEMSPSNKWMEKDVNRLLKGISFQYRINRETELEKEIKRLEFKEESKNDENEELLQELKNTLEDVKNATDLYPPLGCDKYVNWDRISRLYFKEKYSAQDCKIFWNTYLHPEINKGPWTQEENEKLKNLAHEYNLQNWDLIAAELGNNRTGFIACIHYFCKIDPPRQGRFTPDEDKLLCELVEKLRQGDYVPWTKVAHHFKARTRGQLFYRYKYFLSCRSGKIKGKFTEAEDILILVLVDRFGNKFAKCAEYFPNRSVVQIKARYSSNLRGAIKKGSFTVNEDKEILEYVKEFGSSTWEPLVKRLNRCGGQIRQRYKTLMTFSKANPKADIGQAPRRRYSGVSFDTEYEFLRCMADKFRNCEKIPTLHDIEKLLQRNPVPKANPLPPLPRTLPSATPPKALLLAPPPKTYLGSRELRSRRKKEPEEPDQNTQNLVENEETLPKNKEKPAQNKKINAEPKETATERTFKGRKESVQSSPILVEDIESVNTFQDMNLTIDEFITDFFIVSRKLNLEQNISQVEIQIAASAVSSVLSTLQAELQIPKNFDEDSRLDAIDVDILKKLIENRPLNKEKKYVINHIDNNYNDRLIPPNLNTLVGMRSLLIKNEIYKSKHAKRAYIFENFRTESEKQVQWCISNHLSNQSEVIRNELQEERNLFFKRFVSLFKWPAIMTLQGPSEMLDGSSKTWCEKFKTTIRTYKKKPRPALTQECQAFEEVFIKPEAVSYETNTKQKDVIIIESDKIKEIISEAEPSNSGTKPRGATEGIRVSASELSPQLSMAERLKRRINDTLDQLSQSPPTKRFYPDRFEYIRVQQYSKKPVIPDAAQRIAAGVEYAVSRKRSPMPKKSEENNVVRKKDTTQKGTKSKKANKKTYSGKKINNPKVISDSKASGSDQTRNKPLVETYDSTKIKTENIHDGYSGEPHSSFNLGRGELVVENDSPCDSINEGNSMSQDLLDVNVLDSVLKKERNVVEESFDF